MELTCVKCGHVWNYKGKSAFNITCPKCQRKNRVWVKENLKYVKILNCERCGKRYHKRYHNSKYCSPKCQRIEAAKLGAKALHKTHDMKGSNNPNWKGGISKDHYHYRKIQLKRYPEKTKCRRELMKAKKSGKIIPSEQCEHCNKKTKLHAHHEDYSKPLDVIWLCRPCHRKLHGGRH